MNDETHLFRNIHPSWTQGDRVTSQAFKPTPKDNGCLSTYDGDQISASAAFEHFTTKLNLDAIGVRSLLVKECSQQSLAVTSTPEEFKEHVCVTFPSTLSKGNVERVSKQLRAFADVRGWVHGGSANATEVSADKPTNIQPTTDVSSLLEVKAEEINVIVPVPNNPPPDSSAGD